MPLLRYRLRSRAAPGTARIDAAQFRLYRLVAEAGVFTLTGNPATFSAGEAILDAGAGSFALTGNAADLLWHRHLAAGAGSFAMTGIDAGLARGLSLLAEAGVFELTGVNAALTRPTWQLAAETGAFALSGQDAGLLKAGRLVAGAGSFALSGQDIAFALGRAMIGEAGSYALTGNAVDLRRAHRLAAEVGAFILTGNAAGLARTRQMPAGAGSYALTGVAADLLRALQLTAGSGSFALTGNAAGTLQGYRVAAGAGSYALSGQAATLTYEESAQAFTFIGSCVSDESSTLNFGSLSAGSITAGDLAIYIDVALDGSSMTAVTPSGFTNFLSAAANDDERRLMVSAKKASGSEGSITGMNSGVTQYTRKMGLVFRPDIEFTTITSSTPTSEITNGNPSSQIIDPSGESDPVVLIGIANAYNGSGAFSTASPAFDAQIVSSSQLRAGYKIYNSSPASHTIDMNDIVINALAGIYFKVS